jgi:hypothetical protein
MRHLAIILLVLFTCKALSQVKVGTTNTAPDNSAMFEVESTNKGFLPPRVSDPSLITNPAEGLQVFNTTTKCLQIYIQPGGWQNMYCGCTYPASPASGAHIEGETEITWQWSTVQGITEYRINTINDYATATSTLSTSFTETGISCNSSHNFYVWSVNNCGPSIVLSLSANTLVCGPPSCTPGTPWAGGIIAHVSGVAPCTGLITTNANAPGTYLYTNALDYCNNLSEGGFSDWYLPNITELGYLLTNQNSIGGFLQDEVYFSSTASFINQFGGYYNVSSLVFPTGQAVSFASPSWQKYIRCVRAF